MLLSYYGTVPVVTMFSPGSKTTVPNNFATTYHLSQKLHMFKLSPQK
jgi:hypothetical protein